MKNGNLHNLDVKRLKRNLELTAKDGDEKAFVRVEDFEMLLSMAEEYMSVIPVNGDSYRLAQSKARLATA